MRKLFVLAVTIFIIISSQSIFAQSPQGREFGFGIMLGDPTGATLKFWTNYENAFVVDIGSSYFGSPRIDGDYLWHFNAFRSNIVKLYAGPGVAIGLGNGHGFFYNDEGFYVRTGGAGLGVRGVFGVNVIPQTTPLEFFFEVGLLVGIAPDFGSAVDAALGLRFYP